MADITGVLLAAGFSTRFGDNKLLHELDDRVLIAHSSASLSPCDRIVAVVRADDELLQAGLHALGVDCVLNPQPERGMGYSIACAVNATPHSDGWCLLPADMPYIMASTTTQLIAALRTGATLAAPCYQGRRGHPVAFGNCFVDALRALDGDTGARRILEQNMEHLTSITTDDGGVLVDIDTPEDLEIPVSNQ
jgi:molybdenum cofactor cytidylyltransferase